MFLGFLSTSARHLFAHPSALHSASPAGSQKWAPQLAKHSKASRKRFWTLCTHSERGSDGAGDGRSGGQRVGGLTTLPYTVLVPFENRSTVQSSVVEFSDFLDFSSRLRRPQEAFHAFHDVEGLARSFACDARSCNLHHDLSPCCAAWTESLTEEILPMGRCR